MSLYLLKTINRSDGFARVYRDTGWDEYRVRFYYAGVHRPEADYFTTCRDDALSTAAFVPEEAI